MTTTTTALAVTAPRPMALVRNETHRGIQITSYDDLKKFSTAAMAAGYNPRDADSDEQAIAQAMMKIQWGLEIGLTPVAALNNVHLVEGKTTLGAGLIASRIRASGRYDYRIVRLDNEACVLAFYDGGDFVGQSSFTIEDARTAGLPFKTKNGADGQWTKIPRNMCFSRAISNGARWYCPDVFHGAVYTPEELDENKYAPDEAPGAIDAGFSITTTQTTEQPKAEEHVPPTPVVEAVVEAPKQSAPVEKPAPAVEAPAEEPKPKRKLTADEVYVAKYLELLDAGTNETAVFAVMERNHAKVRELRPELLACVSAYEAWRCAVSGGRNVIDDELDATDVLAKVNTLLSRVGRPTVETL